MSKVQQWSALALVAITAVLAGGWFLLIGPVRSEAAVLTEQADTEELATASLTSQLRILQGQAADLPAQQARLAELQAALPDEVGLAELVRLLTATAEETGVELATVAPAGATAPSGPPDAAATATGYAAVPVTLTVKGGFFALEQFIGALEDLPRAFLVTGFSLGPNGGTAGELQLGLNGTVFTSAPVAPAPAAATPPADTTGTAADPVADAAVADAAVATS